MNPADNQNTPGQAMSTDGASAPLSPAPVGFPSQTDSQPSPFSAPTNGVPAFGGAAAEDPPPGSAIGGFQQDATANGSAPGQQASSAPSGSVLDPGSGAAQTQQDQPVVTPAPKSGGGNKKKLLAGLVVALMVLGIGAGVFAMRQQIGISSAWDCSRYSFGVDRDGNVTVQNGSSIHESPQKADVYINGTLVSTFDVPELNPGEGSNLGTVSVPTDQAFTWSVDGTKDCLNSGNYDVQVSAQCSAVVAYDENWAALSGSELSALSEGDIVRFAVSGTTNSGSFDMARFSINGAAAVQSADKRPGSDDFYYEYTIPAGEVSFNVTAEMHHVDLGWF